MADPCVLWGSALQYPISIPSSLLVNENGHSNSLPHKVMQCGIFNQL